MECLEKVIGLSRNEQLEGWKAEYGESLSGMYLDELQGMSLKYCGEVWDMAQKARENAIKTVLTDAQQEANKYIEGQRIDFSGIIGTIQFIRKQTMLGNYGARVFTNLAGAKQKIIGVTILPLTTGNATLSIYNDYDLISTHVIAVTANKPQYFALDVQLQAGSTYFLLEGIQAYANNLTCCGVKWCFNTENPCYNISKRHWTNWIMASGVTGANVNERATWKPQSKFYGMVLHGSFYCNSDDLLCSDYSDYKNNQTDRAISFAIQYKAGELFLSSLMDSRDVSRFTLLGTDALEFNREYYNTRYQTMMQYLVQNLDVNRNDCYVCKTISKVVNRFR